MSMPMSSRPMAAPVPPQLPARLSPSRMPYKVSSAGTRQAALRDSVAAVSVGLVDGEPVLDLDYPEDSNAHVDMNVVRLGRGGFVEVQGTGNRASSPVRNSTSCSTSLTPASTACAPSQRDALGDAWPFAS